MMYASPATLHVKLRRTSTTLWNFFAMLLEYSVMSIIQRSKESFFVGYLALKSETQSVEAV